MLITPLYMESIELLMNANNYYVWYTRYGKYRIVNKCLQLSPTHALQDMGSIEQLINAYNSLLHMLYKIWEVWNS